MTSEMKKALPLVLGGVLAFGAFVYGGTHYLEQRRAERAARMAADEAASKVFQKALEEDRAARAASSR